MRGVSLDITERRRAEQAAHDLSGQLNHAQEDERARLARELHDDVTQRLACLAIDAGQGERTRRRRRTARHCAGSARSLSG